ncbi:MAG: hypothetical protein OSJ45_10845 [Lachnospiraceae bacterium]|nr:hypothetical protein [Lachnospiraceae bacterium]
MGYHCWIGTDVIILQGVTIGDDAVIIVGAVVIKIYFHLKYEGYQ